jgi:hypothetical protein
MQRSKSGFVLFCIAGSLLVLQIPWFFGATVLAGKQMTKTTATVIRIDESGSGCGGSRMLCDRSNVLVPVYEYFDESGKRYEMDDRYFGAFKRNNPFRPLFGKDVGDTVAAYYPPDNPEQVLFMASLLAYTAWLIPLYLAIGTAVIGAVFYIFGNRKDMDLHSLKHLLGRHR